MPLTQIGDYRVGQHGWIEVWDSSGRRKLVEGEILSLIPTHDEMVVYALIRTRSGMGVYRIW